MRETEKGKGRKSERGHIERNIMTGRNNEKKLTDKRGRERKRQNEPIEQLKQRKRNGKRSDKNSKRQENKRERQRERERQRDGRMREGETE